MSRLKLPVLAPRIVLLQDAAAVWCITYADEGLTLV